MTDEESAAQWVRDVLTGKVLLDVTDGEMPLTARTDPNYHPNYKRNYRTQNSDKIRNYQRIYRTENRDKLVADKQELRNTERSAKQFIGWDTEGTNTNATPFLFGSSAGDKIAHRNITSVEMLDLLLEREERQPDAIHVIFGGEYDFNMMLRDAPLAVLKRLRSHGFAWWGDYRIEHVPRKWFQVKRGDVSVRLFDVQTFFGTSYVRALLDNKIGDETELSRIVAGKADRRKFTFDDIATIEPYWRTELKLLPELMDKLRDAFERAGVYLSYWHGPGAVANYMLRQHGIKHVLNKNIAVDYPEVHDAARYGFCGGRFETFQAGRYSGNVYNVDINSAYPYATTMVPDLATGRWEHVTTGDIRSRVTKYGFALFKIQYEFSNLDMDTPEQGSKVWPPQPLFRRFKDDRVVWDNAVTSWYWSPEAWNVRDNLLATFTEAWIYHDDGSRPFSWLADYYNTRQRLKASGDSMQLAFKLGPNSCYGQLAQRAGWERTGGPPKYHQIEYAGFITSVCRAMIYRAAMYSWDRWGLISIDTDGIYSTVPIPYDALDNEVGPGLGQWSAATRGGILVWQSGVYWMPDDKGVWTAQKTRGAPKGQIPYELAVEAIQSSSLGSIDYYVDDKPCLKLPGCKATGAHIHYTRSEMIGYWRALRLHTMNDWRHFVEAPRILQFGGSAWSKRWHHKYGFRCRACRGLRDKAHSELHDLQPKPMMVFNAHSYKHVLPWETNDHDRARDFNDVKGESIVDEIWASE